MIVPSAGEAGVGEVVVDFLASSLVNGRAPCVVTSTGRSDRLVIVVLYVMRFFVENGHNYSNTQACNLCQTAKPDSKPAEQRMGTGGGFLERDIEVRFCSLQLGKC